MSNPLKPAEPKTHAAPNAPSDAPPAAARTPKPTASAPGRTFSILPDPLPAVQTTAAAKPSSKPDWIANHVRRPAPKAEPKTGASPGSPAEGSAAGGESPLMRVSAMAAQLDVSTKRAYHLLATGRIETVNLGKRQTRVVRASFEAYLKALLEGPPVVRRKR